jgi:ABC-type nitrate/sulfonate/bicarbonate transport system substrate-binding protein
MESIKIALDWTFNTNHLGFIIAQELGFYKQSDLEVDLITPDQDNYTITPAKKVELGTVDLALCPLESIISYRTKTNKFPMIAVAALFKTDLSAIACKKEIADRPADLDGKSYASYNARYEDAIVRQMLRNDGGTGDLKIVFPDKLGIWNTIEKGSIDSTWIFLNWEALEAKEKNLKINLFQMKDHNIPYSYSPVIATSEKMLDKNSDQYSKFLKASRKGWKFAQNNITESAKILESYAPANTKLDFAESIRITNDAVGNIKEWGIMELSNIETFLKWLQNQQLENDQVKATDLFTNTLLL